MEWAKGDPLRAQELERSLSGLWFHRGLAWREQEAYLADKERKKAKPSKYRGK